MGLVFSATILLSAALMFTVEPMFAKMVLKLLGGAPSVWNTCLVFYQAALMAGYIYAHLTLKWLGPRRQAVLHLVLLGLAWICLPIGVGEGWTPPTEGNPVVWLLEMLTFCIGLPFLCISASAPVLQSWFAYLGGRSAKDPYFLYAASNLGSLAGLAAYPLLIEPRLALKSQTEWWSTGYGLLMALFALCAVAVWMAESRPAKVAKPAADRPKKEALLPVTLPEGLEFADVGAEVLPDGFRAPVTLLRRLWWLALALVPSALLMGVTAHLAVDIASVPLLWAIPLGLYLLSFIIVFARWPILKWLWLLRVFQAGALVAAMGMFYLGGVYTKDIVTQGLLHLAAFFLTALVCHGELAADRPATEHLTEYYLWMSGGGVLGGLLCALVAPQIFNTVLEYPLILVAACLLRPLPRPGPFEGFRRWSNLSLMLMQGCVFAFVVWAIRFKGSADVAAQWKSEWLKTLVADLTSYEAKTDWVIVAAVLAFLLQRRREWFAAAVATLMGVCLICSDQGNLLLTARSFFGVLRVETEYYHRGERGIEAHRLVHGSTLHGMQSTDPADARVPWTYYYPTGPVGDVLGESGVLRKRRGFLHHGRIGVVGLGTGSIAAYAEPGQKLTYFEIDSKVRSISRDSGKFTYLENCRGDLDIRMGDARLTLNNEQYDNQFDVLLVDAFSSDAIPIHLITEDAVKMYFQKLKPDGLLMLHLSNRHLDLEPVVAATAEDLNLVARVRNDSFDDEDPSEPYGKSQSDWAVLARTKDDLGQLLMDEEDDNGDIDARKLWKPFKSNPDFRPWTDDYSSIVSVMNWRWLSREGVESYAMMISAWICIFTVFGVCIGGVWRTYEKAGHPGETSLVPFYNVYVMSKLVGKPGWWLALLVVPAVCLVVTIVLCVDHCTNATCLGVAVALLGFVFFPLLGMGDARYQGLAGPGPLEP
jgi:hypothetical protein